MNSILVTIVNVQCTYFPIKKRQHLILIYHIFSVDVHSESERDSGCRADNTTLTDCSGKGQCVCGVCECDKRNNPEEVISGKYCECDNFSCERDQGLLCGGPEHGICECGHCNCKPGWMGEDCTCRASNDTCMPPSGNNII